MRQKVESGIGEVNNWNGQLAADHHNILVWGGDIIRLYHPKRSE